MLDIDDLTYERVHIDGKPMWRYSDGTILPVISGGDGSGDDDDDEDDDEPPEGDELAKAKADAEKWKSLSRKHEKTAKANAGAAKELEKLQNANRTEDEQALADAEGRGKKAARAEFAQDLAQARIEGALAGIVDDPTEIVEDLNLSKYVTADGEVDVEAIEKLKARYTSLAGKKPDGDGGDGNGKDGDMSDDGKGGGKPRQNPAGGGARNGGGNQQPKQLSREDLKGMSSDDIVAAKADGRLNDVLGIKT